MARLTEVQRGQAIALLMQGQTQRQVAMQFGVNVSTIERLVRRLRETGRLADRPRTGRPRVTTRRQDRAIRLAHLRNRYVTATETANNTIDRSFSPTSRDSPFFVQMVDVVYTDVVGNVSPAQALLRWIGLVVDQLWSGVEYLTGLSHRWLCWVGP